MPTTHEHAPPPPPPETMAEARRGLNARIRVSHDNVLRAYQAQHRSTRQAVIDQAITEYLDRRGILPQEHQ